jgi:hypothetical protein
MPHQERNPQKVAAKYRAKKIGEAEFELYAGHESAPTISVQRMGAFLHFKTTPEAVIWNGGETKAPFYAPFYLVNLLVTDFSIGNERASSRLADNCMFVIDGETLRHVPLTKIRVLSEAQFDIEKKRIAAEKGESLLTDPESDANPDRPFARARVSHCPAMFGDSESLECTMGLPQADFEKLLDSCFTGRILTAHFHGISKGALSAGFEYEGARDLIFPAGVGFDISIDSVTLVCPCKSEPPVRREVEIAEKPTTASDTEKILAALHHVAAGIETLRSTIIKAGWIMAVALLIATVVK